MSSCTVFQGENLDLAISKEEVMAMIGEGVCVVKTLTRNHLYCEPPAEQPAPRHRTKREGTDSLPEFTVGAPRSSQKPWGSAELGVAGEETGTGGGRRGGSAGLVPSCAQGRGAAAPAGWAAMLWTCPWAM